MTEVVTRQGLNTRDIVVGYGRNSSILEGLSLDVLAGELTVVVGPNACGRSALLRSLARILDIRSGIVELDGRSVANISRKALIRQLGLLAQSSVAPSDMLVEDLIARGWYPYQSLLRQQSHEDDGAVTQAMEDAGVASLVGCCVGKLSGGQHQRVWTAMALAQFIEILLLNEPTTYLDLSHQLEMLRLAEHLQRAGTMVVTVLHDLHLVFRYMTHLVFMKSDEIVAQGASHDVVTADLVERVFSVPCRITDDPKTRSPLIVPIR